MTPSAHLTRQEMEGFRAHALEPGELLRASDHLENCAECRSKLAGPDAHNILRDALLTGPADDFAALHLSFRDLEGLANNATPVDKKAALEAHLSTCDMCAAELRDLREFRSGLKNVEKPIRVRWFVPAGMLLAAALMLFSVIRSRESEQTKPTPPIISASALHDGSLILEPDGARGVRGLTGGNPTEMQEAAAALSTGRLPRGSVLAYLTRKQETLLGGSSPPASGLHPVSPLGEAVLTDRPVFHWSEAAGATEYRVDVYTTDFEKIASSSAVRATEWQPEKPLARGETFTWTVTAFSNGAGVTAPRAPAPEARFRVVSTSEAQEIDILGLRVPRSALLIAIRASELGLLDEARKATDELVAQNPNSALAKRLRDSLSTIPGK